MKNKIFQWSLILLTLIPAFFSWLSVDRAIRLPGSDVWLLWIVPMIWFSIFVIFLCLSTVLLIEKLLIFIAILVAFSFSLFFAFNFWHFLILIFCFILAGLGIRITQKETALRVKINPWKSFIFGKTYVILALAIIIASQYFFTISIIDGQKNMPKLDVGKYISRYIVPVLGFVDPSFKGMDKDGLTVDEYLLSAQKDNGIDGGFDSVSEEFIDSQIPISIPTAQRELLKQEAMRKMLETQSQLSQKNKDSILAEIRRQFSESIGQDLKGDEKVSEVLAGVISQKMNGILQTQLKNGGTIASMLPLIFSLVLFTIALTASWVLSMVWPFLVFVIFKIIVKSGFVKVEKEMVEKESIQY